MKNWLLRRGVPEGYIAVWGTGDDKGELVKTILSLHERKSLQFAEEVKIQPRIEVHTSKGLSQ